MEVLREWDYFPKGNQDRAAQKMYAWTWVDGLKT